MARSRKLDPADEQIDVVSTGHTADGARIWSFDKHSFDPYDPEVEFYPWAREQPIWMFGRYGIIRF